MQDQLPVALIGNSWAPEAIRMAGQFRERRVFHARAARVHAVPTLCRDSHYYWWPGYFRGYRELHQGNLWDIDKTAFNILIERTAKFADHHGRQLEIVFVASGKIEDRALMSYLRELKAKGMPLNTNRMATYEPLSAADFKRIVLGDPHRKNKSLPQLQFADLVLFPKKRGATNLTIAPIWI